MREQVSSKVRCIRSPETVTIVSHLAWVLGTELKFFERVVCTQQWSHSPSPEL